MKAELWVCDRCGRMVETPAEVVIVAEYTPAAVRCAALGDAPPGWLAFADDETVTDACPNCVTAGERADQAFAEAEATVLFGDEGESA
jgi:hypothetical protein